MKAADLGVLSPVLFDPEAYRCLRCALIRYFEWNNADDPENLADEVFCRLLKSIAPEIANLQAFAYGIAQNVLHEHRRERERERNLSSESNPDASRSLHEALTQNLSETLAQDLDECLKCLSNQERSLIQAFYAAERGKKARQRKKLADELGISQNALRIRVSRIRKKLADCIEQRQGLRDEPDFRRSPRKR